MPTLLLTREAFNQFRARTDILVTGCIAVNNLFVFLSCLQSWTTILAPGWSPARAILAAILVCRSDERRSSEVIWINMCDRYLSWRWGFDGKRMLEKDGFGGRRHLQAGEDMTEDRCSLPFGEKSGMFRFSQIHLFWDLTCLWSDKHICLGVRKQDARQGRGCILYWGRKQPR